MNPKAESNARQMNYCHLSVRSDRGYVTAVLLQSLVCPVQ